MGEGLQRAYAATQGVKVGQLWEDNDPRHRNTRTLRIDSFIGKHSGELAAECTVFEMVDKMFTSTGRKVTVLIRRFKPTANGYKLVAGER